MATRGRGSLKRKASKDQPKGFLELCQALGYDPGELLIRRREELADVLARLEAGENVPEWTGSGMRSSWPGNDGRREHVEMRTPEIIGKLRKELMEIDLQLLPYRHPKLRASEINLNVESKSLAELLQEANERRRTTR